SSSLVSKFSPLFTHRISKLLQLKESCFSGLSACGGPPKRHFPAKEKKHRSAGFFLPLSVPLLFY
ncbi:MAG TPA: hypothetical protein IAA04_12660, partial [Candidatus Lachnoclostridium pullistercoris]|nr:hypothetical protein [Candidatus Lachnoclostridium pullistercoris]